MFSLMIIVNFSALRFEPVQDLASGAVCSPARGSSIVLEAVKAQRSLKQKQTCGFQLFRVAGGSLGRKKQGFGFVV